MKKLSRNVISAICFCVFVVVMVCILAGIFKSMKEEEPIYAGPGVTDVKMLSEWFPKLKGTNGDTEVYILDSGVEGASMLVLGGTHPNEPSGVISAIALIEYCEPAEGILYVIPRTNNSAFTCTDPQEAAPMRFYIETENGTRWFRFGSRATNPIDQWPDSEVYVHAGSGQTLSGSETRNINRAYPGREDGNFTERVAYAITQLILSEKISITVDLHEASPEYTTVNAIVAHDDEDTLGVALWAADDFQYDYDTQISVEQSPKNLHGLTHRELGDYTDTYAMLMETANASQGRLHGAMTPELVVTGNDKFYWRASQYGALSVPWDEDGISLTERCARHLTMLTEIAYEYYGDDGFIDFGDFPTYFDIMENGIGAYLADPQ